MRCYEGKRYVYSSDSAIALLDLFEELKNTFSITENIDDMFYFGIFCNAETYANYKDYDSIENAPDVLTRPCQSHETRMDYVKCVMDMVIKKEMQRPEWMIEVEEKAVFNKYGDQPSTFLYLIPKEERYAKLVEKLIEFLYSPTLMITLKNKNL